MLPRALPCDADVVAGAAQVDELLAVTRGRDLSEGAFAELQRLVLKGAPGELRDAILHLRHARVVRSDDIVPCPETMELLWPRLAERAARRVEHRGRIERGARVLGQRLARFQVTLADAQHQLERLCDRRTSDTDIELRLVTYEEGMRLAETAFRRGFDEAHLALPGEHRELVA
jgi:hypothetical protein